MPAMFHHSVVKCIVDELSNLGYFKSNTELCNQVSLVESLSDGRLQDFKRRVLSVGNFYCPFDFLTVFTIASCGGNVKRMALSGLPSELSMNIAKIAFLDCEDRFETPGDIIDVLVEERKRAGHAIRRSRLKSLQSVEPYYAKGSFVVVYINCAPVNWYPCTAYVLNYPEDINVDLRGANFISCSAEVAMMSPHIQDSWIIHDSTFNWSDSYRFLDLMSRTKNAHVLGCTDFSPLLTSTGEILEPLYFLESSVGNDQITDDDCEPGLEPIEWREMNDSDDE